MNQQQSFKINMKGFAIGNGLTDPAIQYGQYGNYAYDNGLISKSQLDSLKSTTDRCVSLINKGRTGTVTNIVCNQIVGQIQQWGGNFNVYDIRLPCVGSMCYDFSPLDDLMVTDEVKTSLGVSDKAAWEECNMQVHGYFTNDWFQDMEVHIPEMLEGGYKVLIYAGKEDFICNWYGNRDWVEEMKWSGQDQYNNLNFSDWKVNGEVAGEFKTVDNLTFLGVNLAGHMVPMDQAENSLYMLQQFMEA